MGPQTSFPLALGALLAGSPAQDAAFVEATVRRLQVDHDVPGVAVAVVRNGEVLCATGLGVRNARTGDAVTAGTRFPLGSVSKSFTSLAILRLVEAGKLDLDRPVLRDLEDLDLSPRPFAERLALRHLLSHTSGLPALPEWPLATREAIVRRLAEVPLESTPGSSWAYCNQNFLLAAYAVERTLGRGWEDLVRAEVFEPLELGTAGVGHDALRRSPDFASPHRLDAREGMVPIEFESHLDPWGPSGTLHASASDMGRYLQFQAGTGILGGRRILSEARFEEMHRPQTSVAVTPRGRERSREMLVSDMGYALGWYTEEYRGLRLVEHEGTLDGFTAGVTLVPSAGFGVALLTNADHAQPFLRAARLLLLERLLGLEPDPGLEDRINARAGFDPKAQRERLAAVRAYRVDPARLESLVGRYEPPAPGEPEISVRRQGEQIFLTVGGRFTFEIVPYGEGKFLTNGPPLGVRPLSFEFDAAGTVTLVGGEQVLGRKRARSRKGSRPAERRATHVGRSGGT